MKPGSWPGGRGYLDTANYGLPPSVTLEALQEATERWAFGRSRLEDWRRYMEDARELFAGLVRVSPDRVACSSATSHLVGLVAASMPEGSRVVIPDNEFTSNVFPWLASGRLDVRAVPEEALVDAVDRSVTLVATSVVQSSSGHVVDLEALVEAASRHGTRVLLDATQACGWMDVDASRFDYVACSAYKWLMCPRGTAFLAVRPDRLATITPFTAGWWSGPDLDGSLYGPPLRLASSARRLDLSPGWIAWAGARASLELVSEIGVAPIGRHDLKLANDLRRRVGQKPLPSPIVAVNAELDAAALERDGIVIASRAGRTRISFHLYNDSADVEAVSRHLAPSSNVATNAPAPAAGNATPPVESPSERSNEPA